MLKMVLDHSTVLYNTVHVLYSTYIVPKLSYCTVVTCTQATHTHEKEHSQGSEHCVMASQLGTKTVLYMNMSTV